MAKRLLATTGVLVRARALPIALCVGTAGGGPRPVEEGAR